MSSASSGSLRHEGGEEEKSGAKQTITNSKIVSEYTKNVTSLSASKKTKIENGECNSSDSNIIITSDGDSFEEEEKKEKQQLTLPPKL